jgi:asparagine synthase (glutamine-hydrolysing)
MMSMRASVEVRVPLLSEPLVELGLGLCHRFKTDGRCGKLVLRELARRWLPESVATHPKHGFSIPLDVMATASFHEMLADRLLGNGSRISAFISTERVGEWLGAFHRAGGGQHGGTISREGVYQRLFILLALELWLGRARLTW